MSFLALGRMRATLRAFVDGVLDPPGAALDAGPADVAVVLGELLLLHADATRTAPTASGTSHRAFDMTDRIWCLLLGGVLSFM
jgi:hypothetical protein